MKKTVSLLLCLIILVSMTSCSLFNKNDSDELVVTVERGEEFKIVQFADLHFGTEGTVYHNADEARTIEFMNQVVKDEKPSLIVLSGDNIMGSGIKGARELVEIMDKYKTPYTFVFGNHDATTYTPTFSKSDISLYLENCSSPYLLYKSGYTETTGENRYGNFSISLKDGKNGDLLGAFIIIDTGIYDYSISAYQSITEGQIDWYKSEIARLNEVYSSQRNNEHTVIPTLTFGHIQLDDHFIAYKMAKENNGAEFVYPQELGGWMQNIMQGSSSSEPSPFFTAMKEMQSSKAYICGHMHGMRFHVKMDGIILGFCPQTGSTSSSKSSYKTFVYTIDESFELNLKLVSEKKEG